MSMHKRLQALDEQRIPIRVALIGCGRFGSMVAAQVVQAPGMELSVVCDLDPNRALNTLRLAGLDAQDAVTTSNVGQANDAIDSDDVVVSENPDVAAQAEVDVVVEATGNPDAGSRHAFNSIMAEKHVVNVTVEADALVGPLLKNMADNAGVVYSLVYGDQPGNIDELYDWAVSAGFEVVAAGKGTRYLPEFRGGTPDEALGRYGLSDEEAAESNLNPQMYNSFQDGTKSAVEMCAVANMTGLAPDVPGMHQPPAGIDDIPNLLRPVEDGGILHRTGVVEVVSCIREGGVEVHNPMRWGVYVVITSNSPYLLRCLKDYGVAMDSTGKYGLMYRPYHLVGMEAPISIAKAALYGEPTGAPNAIVGEVAARAKRPLHPGDILDGEGGRAVYGSLVEATDARAKNLLPIGLSDRAVVTSHVPKDAMLTTSDVETPADSFAAHLRQIQDAALL